MNIKEEKNIDILEKVSGSDYIKKNPSTVASQVIMSDGRNLEHYLDDFVDRKFLNNRVQVQVPKDAAFTDTKVIGGRTICAGNGQHVSILHSLGKRPSSAMAIPGRNPEGYLGELWVEFDSREIRIGNTGSYTGPVYWIVIP